VLREAAERLGDQGREMVIVAPTRKAALVAGAEAGTEASSLSKLLHEHGLRPDDVGRWSRLSPGEVDPATGRRHLGPRPPAVLSARSVVVVDEAGLMTVDQANALLRRVGRVVSSTGRIGAPACKCATSRPMALARPARSRCRSSTVTSALSVSACRHHSRLPASGQRVRPSATSLMTCRRSADDSWSRGPRKMLRRPGGIGPAQPAAADSTPATRLLPIPGGRSTLKADPVADRPSGRDGRTTHWSSRGSPAGTDRQ